ncbi:toxin-antitoxin system HicB family antitoxin [bacterium]|nr:toxin-antitoxin system HicB family antitoxin [bacterium]
MQTTLRIDDELYRQAKAEAAREGVTLTQFIHEALAMRLGRAQATVPPLPTFKAGPPLPDNFDLVAAIKMAEQASDLHSTQAM